MASKDNPKWEIVALALMAETYAVLWNIRQLLKDSNLDREAVYVCSDIMQKLLEVIKKPTEAYK